MFFIVLAADKPGALPLRLEHRQRHLDYWLGQGAAVKVAGAMLDGDKPDSSPQGSSFLLEAEDEAAVRALLAGDPFTKEGVFTGNFVVQPVRPAIGEWRPD